MTARNADDRAARYLLDELPEEDREAFEDEYFGDEQVYDELLAAEDDLIDRYCEGGLSAEQQQRFEERYLASAEGRERVEFARALRRLNAPSPASASVRTRATPRWIPWAAVLVAALAAALLAVQMSG